MRAFVLNLIACCVAVVFGAGALLPANAAQNPASEHISASGAELFVFETIDCAYCFIFRRDVVPDYLKSPRARDVPLRFVDVKQVDTSNIRLNAPLTMLPTIVLMQNGREIDRITGYMGPEPFFYMVSRLLK